jgi:chromosome segregation ATPase
MAESFWESGAAVEAHPQAEGQEQHAEQGSLAVSADDFSGLEQRVLRAVELVKRERQERLAAEARAVQAEERLAQVEERAVQAEGRAGQAEGRAGQAEERAGQAEERAGQAEERLAQAGERATQAEMRAAQNETQLREQGSAGERMQSELNALKAERDHVRQRVERLLQQLDGLEL